MEPEKLLNYSCLDKRLSSGFSEVQEDEEALLSSLELTGNVHVSVHHDDVPQLLFSAPPPRFLLVITETYLRRKDPTDWTLRSLSHVRLHYEDRTGQDRTDGRPHHAVVNRPRASEAQPVLSARGDSGPVLHV